MSTTIRNTRDVTSMLIGWESTFHTMTQHAGRAVTNLHQELGGYSSKTPGSGEPGGGKGGRATVLIRDQRDADDPGDRVPASSVETQALGFAGRDEAAAALDRLDHLAGDITDALRLLCRIGYVDPGPAVPESMAPHRQIVLGYARVRRLRRADDITPLPIEMLEAMRYLDGRIDDLYHLVRRWSYTPTKPAPPRERANLLAVDLTERWCTSHLRVGDKRERDRGELCQWCRKFEAAEGFVPPRELVQLHVDHRRVYDHEIAPFRQAHRDRMRNMTRSGS